MSEDAERVVEALYHIGEELKKIRIDVAHTLGTIAAQLEDMNGNLTEIDRNLTEINKNTPNILDRE